MKHCLYDVARKYPQILMPIKEGIKNTEEYKNVVLRGEKCPYSLSFTMNSNDFLESVNTPAGQVEILSFFNREDFIHAVRALGNKCEPVDVPDSTGAITIFGLNNWDKVNAGLDDYKDSLIILSSGDYSNVTNTDVLNVTNGDVNLSKEEWTNNSILIRKYHELTHFVMRKLYPDDIMPIRDELIADMVGLIGAFKLFDKRLLKLFLGIEGEKYREGGRLQNYEGGSIDNISNINLMIDKLEELSKNYTSVNDVWDNIEKFI